MKATTKGGTFQEFQKKIAHLPLPLQTNEVIWKLSWGWGREGKWEVGVLPSVFAVLSLPFPQLWLKRGKGGNGVSAF